MTTSDVSQIRPGIYQIPSKKPGSHAYLIMGSNKNILIDTGTTAHFPHLKRQLRKLELRPQNVDFVILTHEHFDHIGATAFFFKTAVVSAHRLAANKIKLQDEFVTMNKYLNIPAKPFWVHLWLEDNALIDLGNYKLRIIHTPGHTSGCICVYELTQRLLFSGDTVFAGGTLSEIAASGNISDYANSVERLSNLRINELYPGHGRISHTPEQDMRRAVMYAHTLLQESQMLFEAIEMKELLKKVPFPLGTKQRLPPKV